MLAVICEINVCCCEGCGGCCCHCRARCCWLTASLLEPELVVCPRLADMCGA